MGRQRNNPQWKGKEESTERVLNEIEATKPSDIEFKTIVKGSSMSSVRITKNYREAIRNLLRITSAWEEDIETNSKSQEVHQHGKGHGKYQQEPGGNEEYNF